jgi:hypothetical protein
LHKVFAVRFGKKGAVKKLGSLISPFIREFGLEEAVRFGTIKREWGNIFGEPLSAHMSPARLKNGELLVNVDSPLWLQQLTFLKTQIMGKLSPFEVKELRFILGRVAPVRKEEAQSVRTKGPLLRSEAARQIEDTIAGAEDVALKESIRKAMEKALADRKAK